ncbi:MAG: hypothetical protein P8L66_04035 [Rhodospirillaceae bacterium]|nr:hypothetical protein [Rhodospirillaceae bacterium]
MAKQTDAESVRDYGCGKGALRPAVLAALAPDLDVTEYDQAMLGKDSEPSPAHLVVCIDVMEHIEPDCQHDVLT